MASQKKEIDQVAEVHTRPTYPDTGVADAVATPDSHSRIIWKLDTPHWTAEVDVKNGDWGTGYPDTAEGARRVLLEGLEQFGEKLEQADLQADLLGVADSVADAVATPHPHIPHVWRLETPLWTAIVLVDATDEDVAEATAWAEERDRLGGGERPMTTNGPRYPDVTVQLIGRDGNAFAILGAVNKALRRAGVPKEERDEFMVEAMIGDYNHLLMTACKWVDVA